MVYYHHHDALKYYLFKHYLTDNSTLVQHYSSRHWKAFWLNGKNVLILFAVTLMLIHLSENAGLVGLWFFFILLVTCYIMLSSFCEPVVSCNKISQTLLAVSQWYNLVLNAYCKMHMQPYMTFYWLSTLNNMKISYSLLWESKETLALKRWNWQLPEAKPKHLTAVEWTIYCSQY